MNNAKLYKEYEFSHIPSALSQLNYLKVIFKNKFVQPYIHNIVLGKPYGSLAYLYIWRKFKIPPINVITDDIPFINYFDPTIGNSLGFASGLELGNNKLTWVNLSDAQLSSGPILEAIQFIGKNKQNIKVTIDFNGKRLVNDLDFSLKQYSKLFKIFGFKTFIIKNKKDLKKIFKKGFSNSLPTVFFIITKKGDGIKEFVDNPEIYHYKKFKLKDLRAFKISKTLKRLGIFNSRRYV